MLSRLLVIALLITFTSFSYAQKLPIPAPGRALHVASNAFTVVGNYPSNLEVWNACTKMLKALNASQDRINETCVFRDATSVPQSKEGETGIRLSGGYYSVNWPDGNYEGWGDEAYWIDIQHCPDNNQHKYFDEDNYCAAVINLGQLHSPKENGSQCNQPTCGNPISIGRAGKVQTEVDFKDDGPGALSITRIYNGDPYGMVASSSGGFGTQWSSSTSSHLTFQDGRPRYDCYRRVDNQKVYCYLRNSSVNSITVSAFRPDGKILNFTRSSDNIWSKDADISETIVERYASDGVTTTGWVLSTPSGSRENYDASGLLISIERRRGGVHRYTYSDGSTNNTNISRKPWSAPICNNAQSGEIVSAGHLMCITDDWGRQINFEYDSKGRVSKIFTPRGESYTYGYDGPSGGCLKYSTGNLECSANNLTSVTYPDGKTKLYHYNEFLPGLINEANQCLNLTGDGGHSYLAFLNVLTGITDENGTRYASWGYDCAKRPVSSQHAGGVERIDISYGRVEESGAQNIIVTSTLGTSSNPIKFSRSYHYQTILGVSKNDSVDSQCDGCGDFAERTYDARGNVLTSKDWNGKITQFTYEPVRNLETTRVEAKGTSVERTTTTIWHSTMQLPLKVLEPKKLTAYSYDNLGRMLTRTEQATTDETGSAGLSAALIGAQRTWRYTYNTSGQALSVTGPRRDVPDVTSYTYDSAGNLATVTNPLGHVTTYSNYDRNGRVGHVSAANGLATDIRYNSRGWVTAQTVGDGTVTETTTFDYDGVGQVKKATFPDGSYLNYSYDPAHRLTEVADSAGNRIVYTLDNVGNRIGEQVSGADGVVARQIRRVFDTFKNLTQITGAQQ